MTFPSNGDLTLLDWALAYAEQGWPVFPLKPVEKVPATLKGFTQASTDPDLIEAWWAHDPERNIGLPTGIAFDVLDIDGEPGQVALNDFLAERDIERYRHPGPITATGKGWHLLFAVTGSGNGAALLGPDSKIDFRGIGGYIVAPPSRHPLGHRYTWAAKRGPEAAIPDAPEWLAELLTHAKVTAPDGATSRQLIINNYKTYLDLVAGGALPPDQTPRGLRQRFERPDVVMTCASLGIALVNHGRYLRGRCPYHEDSTPSMAVYPSNNTFHCYGCGAHGDSIDLLNKTHL